MDRSQLAVFSSLVQAAIRLTLLGCGIAVPLADAQTEQVQNQAPRAGAHVVSGTVTNSVTGMPIARALVELDAQTVRHILTDASGMFRFESVPEGLAKLEAERPGFLQPSDVGTEMRRSVSVQVSADVQGIVLKLVPQGVLAGYVRSIQGIPIEAFPVRVYYRSVVDGKTRWQKAASLSSGEDGYFRVFEMPAESVVVSAGPELWRPRPPGAKHLGYPSVFYPNARGRAAASEITVTPGQEVQTDFSLSQEPLFEVSGEVAGLQETIDTKVELSNSSGEALPLVQVHSGRHDFSAYVTEGRYTLRASAEVDGQAWQATVPLTITSNMVGIRVVLGRRPPIAVKVRNESTVNHNQKPNPLTAAVTLTTGAPSLNPLQFVARQLANGDQTSMVVAGVEPGNYSVEISAYGAYVKSAISGSTDLLHDELLVPEDGGVAPVDVVLSDDGGQVTGSVKLPEHDSSATVLLVPEAGSSKEVRTVITEATGQFEFVQVRPGSFILLAFDRVESLEFRNSDVLSRYLSSGVHVSVAERQVVTASPELILFDK
ncbi:MAG: carboxypeptidase regulatory-like domain-containing protein [Acidobacteria bacterium]|nr:carboxypeptidase regulatory-like domain-containing protein [Acidobacteriota bacterium]